MNKSCDEEFLKPSYDAEVIHIAKQPGLSHHHPNSEQQHTYNVSAQK